MADLGKSQIRQVGNLGNSPTGQTGYATGSRGNAYYKFGSTLDAGTRPSRDAGLQSTGVTPAGMGSPSSGGGQHYYDFAAKQDVDARYGKSAGLFGGKSGSSGATQGDTGQLPIPVAGGTSLTTYYLMRARDPDCGGITYRYWVVTGSPDTTGAQYTGARCGSDPLVDIVIEVTWKQ